MGLRIGADLLVVLGPLAQIIPRVFGVLAAAAVALIAARAVGAATCLRRPVLFVIAWFGGLTAIVSGWLCLQSLADYGRPGPSDLSIAVEPLSAAGIHHLLTSETMPVIWLFGVAGAASSLLLRSPRKVDVSAEKILTASCERVSDGRRAGSHRPRRS